MDGCENGSCVGWMAVKVVHVSDGYGYNPCVRWMAGGSCVGWMAVKVVHVLDGWL